MSKQTKVINWCKKRYDEDSKDWTQDVSKKSEDGKIFIDSGIPKCNLFVYDALVSNGVYVPIFSKNGKNWPPNTQEWYDGEVDGFKFVGEGIDGLDNSWPGDICVIFKRFLFLPAYEYHIGFIYSPGKTISAAPDDIFINDWGWREYD